MSIRDRVARLVAGLPQEPQFPTQGATLFIDLERRAIQRGFTPLPVVRTLLSGRGANMYYLHRLLDESLDPLHPDVPLIFGPIVRITSFPNIMGLIRRWLPLLPLPVMVARPHGHSRTPLPLHRPRPRPRGDRRIPRVHQTYARIVGRGSWGSLEGPPTSPLPRVTLKA